MDKPTKAEVLAALDQMVDGAMKKPGTFVSLCAGADADPIVNSLRWLREQIEHAPRQWEWKNDGGPSDQRRFFYALDFQDEGS